MNKTLFDSCIALTTSLSKAEKEVVQRHLKSIKPKNLADKTSKIESLFRQLSASEVDLLTTFKTYNAERKAYENLEARIVDALLLDVNLYRSGKYDTPGSTRSTLNKEMLKIRILCDRGLLQRGYQLSCSLLNKARELEAYDHAIECLNLQLSMVSLHQKPEDFRNKSEDLNKLEFYRSSYRKAVNLYNELNLKKFYHQRENLDIFLANSRNELQRLYELTSSKTILFYRDYFEKEIMELDGNVAEAYAQVDLLEQTWRAIDGGNPNIAYGELQFERSRLCYQLNRHQMSVEFAEQCLQNEPFQSELHQKTLIQSFLSNCMLGDFTKADHILKTVLGTSKDRFQMNPTIRSKWYYYSSIMAFMQGKYIDSLEFLQEAYALEKQKKEYSLLIRLLRAVNYLELERFDELDREMQAFGKYLRRHDLLEELRNMGLFSFVTCLKKLPWKNYNLPEFFKENEELVERAISERMDASTYVDLMELLSFGHWLKAKRDLQDQPIRLEVYFADLKNVKRAV